MPDVMVEKPPLESRSESGWWDGATRRWGTAGLYVLLGTLGLLLLCRIALLGGSLPQWQSKGWERPLLRARGREGGCSGAHINAGVTVDTPERAALTQVRGYGMAWGPLEKPGSLLLHGPLLDSQLDLINGKNNGRHNSQIFQFRTEEAAKSKISMRITFRD